MIDLRLEVSHYLSELKSRRYSINTIKRRRHSLFKYLVNFNSIDIKSIKSFCNYISKQKSANNIISDLKCFIRFLEKYQLIDEIISDSIEITQANKTATKDNLYSR